MVSAWAPRSQSRPCSAGHHDGEGAGPERSSETSGRVREPAGASQRLGLVDRPDQHWEVQCCGSVLQREQGLGRTGTGRVDGKSVHGVGGDRHHAPRRSAARARRDAATCPIAQARRSRAGQPGHEHPRPTGQIVARPRRAQYPSSAALVRARRRLCGRQLDDEASPGSEPSRRLDQECLQGLETGGRRGRARTRLVVADHGIERLHSASET